MDSARTILLHMDPVDVNGARVCMVVLTYRVGDEDYNHVLRHLGGIEPGESKVVAPFPESW